MRVLVTGGNGHLGFNLVKDLLAAGHSVRASVRSLADASRTRALEALGTVELVEAELASMPQLRAAMEGVEVLFHAAATYSYADPAREREVLESSRVGAEHALRAAADARVRKVVLTSSIVTLPVREPGAPPCTEEDWTPDTRVPYFRAKVEAERLAWQLAGELKLDLVTVLPGAIGGPGFSRRTPTLDQLDAMMAGAFRLGVPDLNMAYVDVRDVATVHRLAAERDGRGRFLATLEEAPTWRRIVEVMHAIDPGVGRPLLTLPDLAWPLLPALDRLFATFLGTARIASPEVLATLRGKRWSSTSRKAREVLGWVPRFGLEASLRDTMAALRDLRAGRAGSPRGVGPAAA